MEVFLLHPVWEVNNANKFNDVKKFYEILKEHRTVSNRVKLKHRALSLKKSSGAVPFGFLERSAFILDDFGMAINAETPQNDICWVHA